MKDLNNILPLETAELPEGTEERIKKSVREKIKCSNEREDQIMIKPKTKKKNKAVISCSGNSCTGGRVGINCKCGY